jgi:hypothetical protein
MGKRKGEEIVIGTDKIALTGAGGATNHRLDIALPLREECRHDAHDPHLPDPHH